MLSTKNESQRTFYNITFTLKVFYCLWHIVFVKFEGNLFYSSFVTLFVVQEFFQQSEIQIAFFVGVNEPKHCFELLSNVSYDFDYIYFKKMSTNF